MRIDIARKITAASLRALIAEVEDETVIEFHKTPKRSQVNKCWCGCGGDTKGRFVAGHDSKFHSLAKKVARGLADMPESFIHNEAKDDFMKWHDIEAKRLAECTEEERARWMRQPKPKAEAEPVEVEVTEEPTEDIEDLLAEVTDA